MPPFCLQVVPHLVSAKNGEYEYRVLQSFPNGVTQHAPLTVLRRETHHSRIPGTEDRQHKQDQGQSWEAGRERVSRVRRSRWRGTECREGIGRFFDPVDRGTERLFLRAVRFFLRHT